MTKLKRPGRYITTKRRHYFALQWAVDQCEMNNARTRAKLIDASAMDDTNLGRALKLQAECIEMESNISDARRALRALAKGLKTCL